MIFELHLHWHCIMDIASSLCYDHIYYATKCGKLPTPYLRLSNLQGTHNVSNTIINIGSSNGFTWTNVDCLSRNTSLQFYWNVIYKLYVGQCGLSAAVKYVGLWIDPHTGWIDLLHKSHNASVQFPHAPFCNISVHMRAHFCYNRGHCGMFVSCTVGYARWVYWYVTLMYAHVTTISLTFVCLHYDDVIISSIMSQIASLRIVYSTVYSSKDQRKH